MSTKLIITYDIQNDKLRTRFSKYLLKFGYRMQYSVFEITNSERILDNIKAKIEGTFKKQFTQSDSIIIFHLSNMCNRTHYGYAKNQDKDLIIV
jgi:CRISPR-associated protein Cas2